MKPDPRLHVYFMRQATQEGPIKIGCTRFVGSRLIELAKWSPVPLELIASGPGDFRLERFIHKRFAAQRLHREWFTASAELLSAIEAVAVGVPVAEAFGAEPRVRTRYGQPWLYYAEKGAA